MSETKNEVVANRPKLDSNISLDDYLNYYWLKKDLVKFCKNIGINSNGWKLEIHERIVDYLSNHVIQKREETKPKQKSTEIHELSLDMVVTKSFKRNPQTTAFFKSIDSRFHYSVRLNQYIRDNIGKITYQDIIDEWHKEYELKKKGIKTTPALPQCEYNQFVKDYLEDNKDRTFKDAVAAWNFKKGMRGDNIYHREELLLYDKGAIGKGD
mgnify:CR=1 FL=1